MSGTLATPAALTPRPDDAEVGWGNVLPQHHDRPLTEALVKALLRPLASAGQAAHAMLAALDMDTATGARLDQIGSIVGITRIVPQAVFLEYFGFEGQLGATGFGQARMRGQNDAAATSYTLPDAEYRSLIRAKIALNNGHGTSPEIRDALAQAFRTSRVSVRDQGTARARAFIGRLAAQQEIIASVLPRILPRMAGVTLELSFYEPGRVFGFAGQFEAAGFGIGVIQSLTQIVRPPS